MSSPTAPTHILPPSPFLSEGALRRALDEILATLRGGLNDGDVSRCMSEVDHQFKRILANQQAGKFTNVLNEEQYALLWYLQWEWSDFKAAKPNASDADFLDKYRPILEASNLWIPEQVAHSPSEIASPEPTLVEPPFDPSKRYYVGAPPSWPRPRSTADRSTVPAKKGLGPTPATSSRRIAGLEERASEDSDESEDEYIPGHEARQNKQKRKSAKPAKSGKKPKKEEDMEDVARSTARQPRKSRPIPRVTNNVFLHPCDQCKKHSPPLACRILDSRTGLSGACHRCNILKIRCVGQSSGVVRPTPITPKEATVANAATAAAQSKMKSENSTLVEDDTDVVIEVAPHRFVNKVPPLNSVATSAPPPAPVPARVPRPARSPSPVPSPPPSPAPGTVDKALKPKSVTEVSAKLRRDPENSNKPATENPPRPRPVPVRKSNNTLTATANMPEAPNGSAAGNADMTDPRSDVSLPQVINESADRVIEELKQTEIVMLEQFDETEDATRKRWALLDQRLDQVIDAVQTAQRATEAKISMVQNILFDIAPWARPQNDHSVPRRPWEPLTGVLNRRRSAPCPPTTTPVSILTPPTPRDSQSYQCPIGSATDSRSLVNADADGSIDIDNTTVGSTVPGSAARLAQSGARHVSSTRSLSSSATVNASRSETPMSKSKEGDEMEVDRS